MSVAIPTELIGSVPRPIDPSPKNLQGEFVRHVLTGVCRSHRHPETIRALEATGEAMVTDGEQTKPSFVGYPLVRCALRANSSLLSPSLISCAFRRG